MNLQTIQKRFGVRYFEHLLCRICLKLQKKESRRKENVQVVFQGFQFLKRNQILIFKIFLIQADTDKHDFLRNQIKAFKIKMNQFCNKDRWFWIQLKGRDFIKLMLKESTQPQEDEQTEQTNFEKMELEILKRQNRSLFNELQRLESFITEQKPSSEKITAKEEIKTEAFRHSLIYLSDIFIQQIDLLDSFNHPNHQNLNFLRKIFHFVKNTCQNKEHQTSDQIREFLNKNQLENFLKNFINFNSFNEKSGELSLSKLDELSQMNSNLQIQLSHFQKLEKLSLEKSYEEMEDLKWENKILQNKLSFFNRYDKQKFQEIIEDFPQKETFYCYCGGKAYEVFDEQQGFIQKLEQLTQKWQALQVQKSQPQPSTEQVDSQKYQKLKEKMQEELKNVIELAESRRVDKNTLTEKLYKTKLFSKLETQYVEAKNYIEILEKKCKEGYQIVQTIQNKRKQEILEFQYQCKVNTNQLVNEIDTLKHSLEGKEKLLEDMGRTIVKYQQIHKQKDSSVDPILENIIKIQINSLKDLQNNFMIKTESLERKLLNINNKCIELEQEKSLPEKMFQSDFRHKTMKNVFEILNQKFQGNSEMEKQLVDLEIYVKSREKKISKLESTIRHLQKSLDNEKNITSSLLNEITNSTEAFSLIVKERDSFVRDIELLNNNIVELLKEKNTKDKELREELDKYNKITIQKEAELKSLETEFGYNRDKQRNLQSDHENILKKNNELQYFIEENIKQSDYLLEQNNKQESMINLLQKKNLALQDSNQKLQNEVAQNLTNLAEKELIINSILSDKVQFTNESGEISIDQKRQYYMMQMEVERLRKIVMCKACNEREKEVILTTCFHCFCQTCVDKNFKERNRQCPICLVKMSKYEIKRIYLDQLICFHRIFFNNMSSITEFFLIERLLQDRDTSDCNKEEVEQKERYNLQSL